MRRFEMDDYSITHYIEDSDMKCSGPVMHSSLKMVENSLTTIMKIINKTEDEWYQQLRDNIDESGNLQTQGRVHLSAQLLFNVVHVLSFYLTQIVTHD